jgi:pimeloyl-ACP methyl ester carboxylesterase
VSLTPFGDKRYGRSDIVLRSHYVYETMDRSPSALILLHGFGSSFDHNWRQTGWLDILADFGVTVPAIDLPGHGSSRPLPDPADYADVQEQVRHSLPADGFIAGVGFSAGAELLLRLAVAEPSRFDRIALLGLGDNVFEPGDPAPIAAALESSEEPADIEARLFRRLAQSAGNDPMALSAFLRRPGQQITEQEDRMCLARSCWCWVIGTRRDAPTG